MIKMNPSDQIATKITLTDPIFNKSPSRRAKEPHLSYGEKERALGGWPPKGLQSPCSGSCCRTSSTRERPL